MNKSIIPTGRTKGNQPNWGTSYPAMQFMRGNLVVMDDSRLAYITDAFTANSTVYSIITIITDKFASIPQIEYKQKAGAKDADVARYKCIKQNFTHKALINATILRTKSFDEVEGKVTQLLNKPNNYQSKTDFKRQALGFKLITGEAFIRVIRANEGTGEPLELELLPSQWMNIHSDGTLYGVAGYELNIGGSVTKYKPEEIIHWKYWNPNVDNTGTHLHGLSPIKAGTKDINANSSGKTAAAHMFQNQGANGLMSPKESDILTREQALEIRDKVDERINGNENKSKTVAVAVPMNWQQIGLNAIDMALIEGNRLTKNDICALFNFPLNLIENTHSTLGNIEQDIKRLTTGKVITECESYDEMINSQLMPMFGNMRTVHVSHDYTGLPELQDEFEKLHKIIQDADYLTQNEKRSVMKWDDHPDPNMSKVYMSGSKVPLDQLNMDLGVALSDELEKAGVNDYKI